MTLEQLGIKMLVKEIKTECLHVWHGELFKQAYASDDVIISSDIGNNCAIGNAYPTFEKGRKYLAPGLIWPMWLWFSINTRSKNWLS